jgi:multiple sugar transport system permease protein
MSDTSSAHAVSAKVDRANRVKKRHWPIHLALSLGAVVMCFPFYWEFITAFKTYAESRAVPATFWPRDWVDNFTAVFQSIPILRMARNSFIITAGRMVGQITLCTMAGYGFARLRFPGRNVLFMCVLGALMVPWALFLLPQFEITVKLGLANHFAGAIIPCLFSSFGIFLMRQFFLSLPRELEDAAIVDGANTWQIFWHVMLPLAKPGIIALAVFTALWGWNDLLWPMIVLGKKELQPLSVGVALLSSDAHFSTNYPQMMAAGLIAMLPMLVVFIILQRHFIAGIAFTGSKG